MSKQNTLVLRMPSAKNSGSKMTNMGVGFVDSVTLEGGEKRSVVHFLPEMPLAKGNTIFVFPSRGMDLPVEITGHAHVGDREPSHVLYHKDVPCGSSWVHLGKRTKFLVVKVNRDVPDQEGNDKRFTLFSRFVKEKSSKISE
ncbi:MAG: hypothetical protein KKA10_16210 [Euryarchaeota archaeon]|nr:hypothetical protein [Euryarchaeota archaeon]MCG2735636.1 hypothetical protein [Candidatus Methanoperedenaceae archaeon]